MTNPDNSPNFSGQCDRSLNPESTRLLLDAFNRFFLYKQVFNMLVDIGEGTSADARARTIKYLQDTYKINKEEAVSIISYAVMVIAPQIKN